MSQINEDLPAANGDDDDLIALQKELERKKSRIQMLQERRRIKEEAQRLQREAEERFQAKVVMASMELLTFVKSFLEFVEILPREQMERIKRNEAHGGTDPSHLAKGQQRLRAAKKAVAAKKRLAEQEKERALKHRSKRVMQTNDEDDASSPSPSSLRRRKSSVAFQEIEEEVVDDALISDEDGGDETDTSSSEELSASDDDDAEHKKTKFYIIPAFLLHSVESFFARVGIILRKRVGPGGVITIERHRKAFQSVRAEYPQHVVTVMLTYLAQHVVPPPPTIDEERLPFAFTEDDEVWEKTAQNVKEWLAIMGVTKKILHVDRSLRELLWHLRAYPLPRLTRIVHNVTRDVVSVCAQEAGAGSANIIVDDEVTKNIHHHTNTGPAGAGFSNKHNNTLARRESLAASLRPVDTTDAATKTTPKLEWDAVTGVAAVLSRSPVRSPSSRRGARTPLSVARSSPVDRPSSSMASTFATRGDRCFRTLDESKVLPDIVICAKGLDPPLCFSDYSRIAPAHWAPMKLDDEVFVDAEPLRFGSQVGEPPIAGTPFRTVLQAKWSHYLYSAKELPMYAAPDPNRSSHSNTALLRASSDSAKKDSLLDAAIRGRLGRGGRVAVDRDVVKDATERLGRNVSQQEKMATMAAMSGGSQLVATHQRVMNKGKRVPARKQFNTSVISRGCLPIPDRSGDSTTTSQDKPGLPHSSHLLLPIEAVDKLMKSASLGCGEQLQTQTVKKSKSVRGHSPTLHSLLDAPNSRTASGNNTTLRDSLLTIVCKEATTSDVSVTQPRSEPRLSVRMATLRSLVGRDTREDSEALSVYWERLQGMELKLSLLRGSGSKMPLDERLLWKQLWHSCHEKMEIVVTELKHHIAAAVPGGSKRDVGATSMTDPIVFNETIEFAQQLVGGVVESGLMARLGEFSSRLRTRRHDRVNDDDDGGEGDTDGDRVHENQVPRFARALHRSIRPGAFEQNFESHGVSAIESRISGACGLGAVKIPPVHPRHAAVAETTTSKPSTVTTSGGWTSRARSPGRLRFTSSPPLVTPALLRRDGEHSEMMV